jgi:pimeloyl-ACP methyl ester carboxylesterase
MFLINKYPNKIKKACLLGSGYSIPSSTSLPIWYFPSTVLEWMRPLFSKSFKKNSFHEKTDEKLIIEEGEATSKINNMFITKSYITQLKWPNDEEIKNIKTPTLVLSGETDGILKPEDGKKLSDSLENSKFYIINDSSHNLMLEKPDDVNDLIFNFFKN